MTTACFSFLTDIAIMKITPEIQFIQDKCILAAHPWLSLEEAKNEEENDLSCLLISDSFYHREVTTWISCQMKMKYIQILSKRDYFYIHRNNVIIGVFWLPPCLARVLNGLWQNYFYRSWRLWYRIDRDSHHYCNWKLLNPDWSPATLFDQSDETINAIAKEMWYSQTI